MHRSRVAMALLFAVTAIVIQTTLFAPGRVQPFGVGPAFITLVVIAAAAHVEAEYAILIGFSVGMLMDLVGGGTLGIWAMTLTVVVFAAVRLRERFGEGTVVAVPLVFGLTVLGQLLFVLLATLFGHGTITESGLLQKILVPGVWNVLLMVPVFWILGKAFRSQQRRWAT